LIRIVIDSKSVNGIVTQHHSKGTEVGCVDKIFVGGGICTTVVVVVVVVYGLVRGKGSNRFSFFLKVKGVPTDGAAVTLVRQPM